MVLEGLRDVGRVVNGECEMRDAEDLVKHKTRESFFVRVGKLRSVRQTEESL